MEDNNGSNSDVIPATSPANGGSRKRRAASKTPSVSGSRVGSSISSPLHELPPDLSSNNSSSTKRQVGITSPRSEMSSPIQYEATSDADKSMGASSLHSGASTLTRSRRYRADIFSSTKHHRNIQLDDTSHDGAEQPTPSSEPQSLGPASSGPTGPRVVIWGTNICVQDVQLRFRRFLQNFHDDSLEEDEIWMATGEENGEQQEIDRNLPYYLQKMKSMGIEDKSNLNINLQHVRTYDERLYRQIVSYPAEIIPYLDMVVSEVLESIAVALSEEAMIRPFNAQKTRNMRGLNPEDIDQLITVSGMVIRASNLIPEMRVGYFQCTVCKSSVEVEVDRGRIEEPRLCTHCNINFCFQLIHNKSKFMDKQMVKLQESPDDMPAGQTPHTVTLFVYGDLVDTVQPGDRVTVTGIYRATTVRINPRLRLVKAVYRTYVDVLHFRKVDVNRLHESQDGTTLTAARIKEIYDLSSKPDVYERLAHALAPSIYEHEDIKKGILCLLFGGTRKDFTESGRGKFRADINMLLCGDPGTSKSQLLQYVHNLVPRGQYTNGKGSSAVGLTAYLTKDPDTKHGALVLSDNGVCCIDEFDKMSDQTRSVLHEVMEQQTLSIAKAGIICQLNARTSILAAANPVDSQWNKDKTIIENVQLPHTLLSRFDLIFLMVDPQDEFYDRRLAHHLVSLYYRSQDDENEEFVNMSLLRDYIAYARANIHPKLSEDASISLTEKYVEMRKVGSGKGRVSAFPRQLESLIRLGEARAKIRLSELVELADVEEAYRLYREALKQSAVDPLTGKVDPGYGNQYSAQVMKEIRELSGVIRHRLRTLTAAVGYKQLLMDLSQNSDRMIQRQFYDEALSLLSRDELIIRDTLNRVKLTPKGREQATTD